MSSRWDSWGTGRRARSAFTRSREHANIAPVGGPFKAPGTGKSVEPILPLRLTLPARSSGLLVRSLHEQLRTAIRDGRLQPGLQLPPTRSLARALRIARNTALAAYHGLLSEGYLVARRGAGTFVADVRGRFIPSPPTRQLRGRAALSKRWLRPPAFFSPEQRSYRYNFAVGTPDIASLPFETWARCARRATRGLRKADLIGGDTAGRAALRHAIAQHVSFARAIACEPNDIIVTAGAQQAFDLLARVLVTPRRTVVALEEPCYPPLRHVMQIAGARIATAPVDEEGLVVDRVSSDARIVCVTPSHQFPLGYPLSIARRAALLRFARKHRATVIEDDYDGEYHFGGGPLDALKTLDHDERVFYVGTFSKSLFPALRLGYIVAPSWARPALIAAKTLVDRHCSIEAQDTLAAFITEGHLARYVRKMTRIYAERRTALLTALARHCRALVLPMHCVAGLHISAELLVPTSAQHIVEGAERRGLKLQAVSRYASGKDPINAVALGYGAIGAHEIDAGISLFAEVARETDTRARERSAHGTRRRTNGTDAT